MKEIIYSTRSIIYPFGDKRVNINKGDTIFFKVKEDYDEMLKFLDKKNLKKDGTDTIFYLIDGEPVIVADSKDVLDSISLSNTLDKKIKEEITNKIKYDAGYYERARLVLNKKGSSLN